MTLVMMAMECYDGIVVHDDKGNRVRVAWRDMVSASWMTLPGNEGVAKHFVAVPADARAVNASGRTRVLPSRLVPV